MTFDLLLAFVAFAFVTAATPGPNNVMLLASGANFGFLRSVPHMLGIAFGLVVMVVASAWGWAACFGPTRSSTTSRAGSASPTCSTWPGASRGPGRPSPGVVRVARWDFWAPLLCAGVTTYSPLRHWGVGPGTTVGIFGLGGLGRVALKLAHVMGAEVVQFTTPPDKADAARELGADGVVLSNDEGQMAAQARRFDFIPDTAAAPHALAPYLSALKLDGTLCMVGIPEEPLNVEPLSLIAGRKSLAGSGSGGTREMLDFCARHGITADVELVKPEQVNEALDRLARNDVRYRFVIDMTAS